jgi:catechol 2,3-dioxygenase-like lactoylglutathione lyase family enzyme
MPGTTPGPWARAINTVTLFVDDLDATRRFYQDVFGLPVVFEDQDSAVFRFGPMQVNLLRSSEAGELIEPAPVAPATAGSRFQFTIEVDDVDATYAELTARGVTFLNGPIDRPWGVRTAAFRDPAGHVWEIAK